MKDLIIVGAGGMGRKVHVCLKRLNADGKWNIKGFIDDIYLDEFINELFSLLSNEHFIKFLIL